MALIRLICKQCGGSIVLNDSHEIGTCEYCFTQYIIKNDHIIQNITQNITKYVYGYDGKDIEELLQDGYKLMRLHDDKKANLKFKKAIDLDPNCWSAWLGYAETGGDRSGYLSIVPAYKKAYNVTSNEQQELDTFVNMTQYLPDINLRSAFIRAFNLASQAERHKIFNLVSGVIGCDDSEIASLAIDLCPNDWRSYFSMAKFRQIRVRWCKLEGNFLTGKRLPSHAIEVMNVFMKAYRLAKNENSEAVQEVITYINDLAKDSTYNTFYIELKKQIDNENY